MEAIRRIVQEIIFMCRVQGVCVSDTLGAFVARAVVLENAARFPLEKELNENDVQDLIKLATERLLEKDSPSLETVKMQVGFDLARAEESEELEKTRLQRQQREASAITEISGARLRPGNDVEAITSLYRKIFNFLLLQSGIERGAERPTEREIAAALESVFPRIGLKAFTGLPPADKAAQLVELANIILGIRLFNRHIGKGGAGIVDIPTQTRELSAALIKQIEEEMRAVGQLCSQYVELIASKYSSADPSVKPTRLQQELTNRRQYFQYLKQLEGALDQARSHSEQLTRMLTTEMESLKDLVGSRTSVPKEQVYPRFDAIAKLWYSFEHELALLRAREHTLAELQHFKETYVETIRTADVAGLHHADHAGLQAGEAFLVPDAAAAAAVLQRVQSQAGIGQAERLIGEELHQAQQIRLELEGFCPVTIVQRDGLLLPCSPAFMVRFNNRVYGFVDEPSLTAFVAEPHTYLQCVLQVVKGAPELIHVLHLQEHFPAASIVQIMRQQAAQQGPGGALLSPKASFQDCSMQTPVHFQEKNVDMSYEWNEWVLRRRALQQANLRQKKTTSQQAGPSALRRDAETQVYLPKEGETQTAVSTGTGVPVSRNFVAGLRGSPTSKMSLVNLTYDPETVIGITM